MNLKEIENKLKILYSENQQDLIDKYLKDIIIQKIKSFQSHLLYALKNKYSKNECIKILNDGNQEIEKINKLCFDLFKFNPYKKDILTIHIKNDFPNLIVYLGIK